jgi:signal transduction histidine kinase
MTDMSELTGNVVSLFKKQASGKKFAMESEISHEMPKISVDKEAVSRALLNLLDNALKYSGENPKVIIRAWSDEKNVFLEVQDNGRGINKEEQRKVFEKFYRTDDVYESKVKGSGIGLNLVAHIVKGHGGEVALESDVGKGTKVTIKLPHTEKRDNHG